MVVKNDKTTGGYVMGGMDIHGHLAVLNNYMTRMISELPLNISAKDGELIQAGSKAALAFLECLATDINRIATMHMPRKKSAKPRKRRAPKPTR
jgi:hypothetical protein